jgi:hypothetical protein
MSRSATRSRQSCLGRLGRARRLRGSTETVLLGAIAGLTTYLGLPVGRLGWVDGRLRVAPAMFSVGILTFIFVDDGSGWRHTYPGPSGRRRQHRLLRRSAHTFGGVSGRTTLSHTKSPAPIRHQPPRRLDLWRRSSLTFRSPSSAPLGLPFCGTVVQEVLNHAHGHLTGSGCGATEEAPRVRKKYHG